MSAVSMSVTPASSAARTVATASSCEGRPLPFIDTGIAPSPMAETVNGPSVRCDMSLLRRGGVRHPPCQSTPPGATTLDRSARTDHRGGSARGQLLPHLSAQHLADLRARQIVELHDLAGHLV